MKYAVRFDYPDVTFYAGLAKGAFGWAPTLKTALLYDDAESAQRVLKNAYGPSANEWGKVVSVNAEEMREAHS